MAKIRLLKTLLGLGFAAAMAVLPAASHAYTLTLDQLFGDATPSGYGGSLSVTIEDIALNTVKITIDAAGLTFPSEEKVMDLYLNASSDPSLFTYAYDAVNSTGPSAGQPIFQSTFNLNDGPPPQNDLKADGDGFYDLAFRWDTAASTPENLFEQGEKVIYTVTGTGVTAALFNLFSAPGPGAGSAGPYLAAAHILGIAFDGEICQVQDGCSAYVGAVPLPAAAWLLAPAIAGLAGFARRRRVAA
jgi:hypothetical protein